MNNYTLIKDLLSEVEDFEKSKLTPTVDVFAAWLSKKHTQQTLPGMQGKEVDFMIPENQKKERFPEVELSTLLTGVFRFAKHYVKKALDKTEVRTLEEFGFLAMLLERGEMSKSELIQQHLIELSSGTEISKRLLKNELILEFMDPKDRRAKRVQLTAKGRTAIIKAFGTMHQAALVIKGNLEDQEMNHLINMLSKLNDHHWNIHESDKDSSLNVLVGKYV